MIDLLIDILGTAPSLSEYLSQNVQVLDAVIGGSFWDDWPEADCGPNLFGVWRQKPIMNVNWTCPAVGVKNGISALACLYCVAAVMRNKQDENLPRGRGPHLGVFGPVFVRNLHVNMGQCLGVGPLFWGWGRLGQGVFMRIRIWT